MSYNLKISHICKIFERLFIDKIFTVLMILYYYKYFLNMHFKFQISIFFKIFIQSEGDNVSGIDFGFENSISLFRNIKTFLTEFHFLKTVKSTIVQSFEYVENSASNEKCRICEEVLS